MATNDGDDRVIATAQHIVRSLGKNENMTEDMVRILSNFDDRFSNMDELIQETKAIKKVNESLDHAEETIMRWDASVSKAARQTMIWDCHPEEAAFYLNAVDDVQSLMGALSTAWSDRVLLDRAQNILQAAIARLTEEFRHMLEVHSETVDLDWLLASAGDSLSSANGEGEDDYAGATSNGSDNDDDDEDIPIAYPVTDLNLTLDPIPLDRVRDLNAIAQRMVTVGFGKECCEAFLSVRKTVLEQSLCRLGAQRLNVEVVQRMTWEALEVKIKKWIQAMKVAMKVILPSERKLSGKVFTGLSPWRETCFEELVAESMMQFLNFGKAVAITSKTPEKLFRILDMYELLRDLLPEVNAIFCDDISKSVRSEVTGVLTQLGEAALGTLTEFENAIERDASKTPVPGGAFHPLTRYVMNYIKFLIEYSESLKELLGDRKRAVPSLLGLETFGLAESFRESGNAGIDYMPPLAVQVILLIVYLERNLEMKSKLYKDPALAYLFLMNNIHYIVEKVKQSDLAVLVGHDWARQHSGQLRVYAANYVRTAWKKVCTFLRDEGLPPSGTLPTVSSRVAVKDRLRNFNSIFEEVYVVNSKWIVPDLQLREDLRNAIADKLIPTYTAFIQRFAYHLDSGGQSEKYIKYTPDDLERYVIDLFDGTT